MLYLWESFRAADVKTLLYALVWESFFATVIILIFYKYSALGKDRSGLLKTALLQTFYTIGFFLLYGRNELPVWLSSTIGNPILFLAFYTELRLMLQSMHITNKYMDIYLLMLLAVSSSIYILQDLLLANANYRIALSSLFIFLFFFPFIIFVLLKKNSHSLHRFAASTSLPLAIAAVPRFYSALTSAGDYTLYHADACQGILFLSFLIKFYCTSSFFFIFLKMDADEEIRAMAATDELTGLFNRRTYLQMGGRLFERCQYSGDMIGIFFLDIDSFKMINDEHRHAKGDEVLKAFADTISQHLRPQDICCRYGGDEFSICLKLSSADAGTRIANRILYEIEKIDIPEIHVTTSIGLAYGIPCSGDNFVDFIDLADKAMYMAKKTGKNQFVALSTSEHT